MKGRKFGWFKPNNKQDQGTSRNADDDNLEFLNDEEFLKSIDDIFKDFEKDLEELIQTMDKELEEFLGK